MLITLLYHLYLFTLGRAGAKRRCVDENGSGEKCVIGNKGVSEIYT
jgi:hypothetical protein